MIKQQLRSDIILRRDSTDPAWRASASTQIADHAEAVINRFSPSRVSIFVGRGSEVNTEPLIRKILATQKAFLAPRVVSDGILMLHTASDYPEGFTKGSFGILEPDPAVYATATVLADRDLVFVPGLIFSRIGARIGYGGGYYDRLLAASPHTIKIGLGFSFQLMDELPEETHDMRLNGLITENGFMEFGMKS